MRIDVLVQKYGLNERQGKTIEFLLTHGKLTIKNFEELCPEDRRDFQRNPATGGIENAGLFHGSLPEPFKKADGSGLIIPI